MYHVSYLNPLESILGANQRVSVHVPYYQFFKALFVIVKKMQKIILYYKILLGYLSIHTNASPHTLPLDFSSNVCPDYATHKTTCIVFTKVYLCFLIFYRCYATFSFVCQGGVGGIYLKLVLCHNIMQAFRHFKPYIVKT